MISIFSKDTEEESRRKDLYLNRLKETFPSIPANSVPPGKVQYLDDPAGNEAAGRTEPERTEPQHGQRVQGWAQEGVRREPPRETSDSGKADPGAPAEGGEVVSLKLKLPPQSTEPEWRGVAPVDAAQPAVQDSIRQKADKIARHFAEALGSAMSEMQSVSSQSVVGIQDSLLAMAAETERLNAGLKTLRKDVDEATARSRSSAVEEERTAEAIQKLSASVEHSRRLVDAHTEAVSTQGLEIQQLRQEVKQQGEAGPAEMRNRLDPMEQKLRDLHKEANQAQASVSAMDERFSALERRLDSQAEAIKALHAATQGFGARQEILQDLLQKMIGGDRAVQPLPESL